MTGLRLPPPLRTGDRVALVAPASPCPPDRVARAVRGLERLGYAAVPFLPSASDPAGYRAGPPEERAAALNAAFRDPSIRGIWCLRGGYSAAGVLPYLDYPAIARQPKVFVGYSDITCLHTALHRRCGFVTFHGPMAADLGDRPPDPWTWASLTQALAYGPAYENPPGAPLLPLVPGQAEGVLEGGNLSLLCSRLGTPWALDPEGILLFLEEVGEPLARAERLLVQLRDAGWFHKAAGVLLGQFTRCENPHAPGYDVLALCRDLFRDCSKPVYWGLSCGHGRPNGTLPLGRCCRVAEGRLLFFN